MSLWQVLITIFENKVRVIRFITAESLQKSTTSPVVVPIKGKDQIELVHEYSTTGLLYYLC